MELGTIHDSIRCLETRLGSLTPKTCQLSEEIEVLESWNHVLLNTCGLNFVGKESPLGEWDVNPLEDVCFLFSKLVLDQKASQSWDWLLATFSEHQWLSICSFAYPLAHSRAQPIRFYWASVISPCMGHSTTCEILKETEWKSKGLKSLQVWRLRGAPHALQVTGWGRQKTGDFRKIGAIKQIHPTRLWVPE